MNSEITLEKSYFKEKIELTNVLFKSTEIFFETSVKDKYFDPSKIFSI